MPRHLSALACLLLLCAVISVPALAANGDPDGIVYVRVPRAQSIIQITEVMGFTYKDEDKVEHPIVGPMSTSFMDSLPEVHFIHGGFSAPGQLVWQHANGTETIIYDCKQQNPDNPGLPTESNDTCVPMDPAVSYDGNKVAFAVYHGTYSEKPKFNALPPKEVGKLYASSGKPGWSGIFIYDFRTGQLTEWAHNAYNKAHTVYDNAPVWLPNGKIMFTSTRAPGYSAFVLGYFNGRKVQQLWIADADGSNARNVSPHEQFNALHPFVHSAGRVFYSSHQFNEVRLRGHTVPNLWWLQSVDLRGGDLNAHLGAHARNIEFAGATGLAVTALHFLGERSNGDMCADMYYRGNNFGAGRIICWPALTANDNPDDDRSPLGHEGPNPFDKPQGLYTAVGGDSGDSGEPLDGPTVHVRDPAGSPADQLLFAASLGPNAKCHYASIRSMIEYTQNGLRCDMGIYRSTRIPVRDDSSHGYGTADTEVVVNSAQWHEFMPRPVMPYIDIYGMNKPSPPTPPSNTGDSDTSYGIFASVNSFEGNVRAADGWRGPRYPQWCKEKGCSLHAVPLSDMTAMRFWKIIRNDQPYKGSGNPFYNTWGQKLELLGDVPLQSDGSFMAKLPADVPFLMSGVDKDGRAIARHQQPMSLRPGEKQVCAGCHLHDTTVGENAQHPFDQTLAASLPAVSPELDAGEMRVLEWKADIYTMLKDNCGSCHNGTQGSNPPNLVGISGFNPGSDPSENVYGILLHFGTPGPAPMGNGKNASVPWVSRYVNVFFARESLLYWKAAGERTDGRADDERTNDFNFGPAHPSHLTAAELTRLADWIEAGSYMDQHADVDIIFQNGFEQ